MVFYGQWHARLDNKRRTPIPSRFRKELGKEVIIIQNEEDVLVYPGKKIRQFSAEQMGQLWLVKVYNQGRIVIPKEIYESFFSGHNITWVGWKDYFKVTGT